MVKLLLFLPIAAVSAIWGGFVLSILWAWFVVPVFHAPALRIPYAIGLAIVCHLLTQRTRHPDDEPETLHVAIASFVVPATLLLFGWVVTWFI
jgi:hypothetical protein